MKTSSIRIGEFESKKFWFVFWILFFSKNLNSWFKSSIDTSICDSNLRNMPCDLITNPVIPSFSKSRWKAAFFMQNVEGVEKW